MQKKLAIIVVAGIVCAGCAGFLGGSSAAIKGLLFFRNNGSGSILHRMASGGGTITDVPNTDDAFEGSMNQSFDVYTSLTDGNISRMVNGIAFPLTSSGLDFRPCVTPDGSRIAFVSTRDGNTEVYTMNGNGTNQTNVSGDAAFDGYAAISRDGTKVVFTSIRDGDDEIYIVNFNGTGLTRLTTNAADDVTPAFTPDGTQIIFSSNRTGGIYQIFRMNANGTNVTQVTTSSDDKFHASYKVDGSGIFFYINPAVRQIVRCNPDGSGETQLTTGLTDSDKMATWIY